MVFDNNRGGEAVANNTDGKKLTAVPPSVTYVSEANGLNFINIKKQIFESGLIEN